MKTILILAILVILVLSIIYIVKKLKKPTTTTTTTLPLNTTTTTVAQSTTTTTLDPVTTVQTMVIGRPSTSNESYDLCQSGINEIPPVLDGSQITVYFYGSTEVPVDNVQLYTIGMIPFSPASEYSDWGAALGSDTTYSLYNMTITTGGIKTTHSSCVVETSTTTYTPTTTNTTTIFYSTWYITVGSTNGCSDPVGSTPYYAAEFGPFDITAFYRDTILSDKWEPGDGTIGWHNVASGLASVVGDIDGLGNITNQAVC
jgi:hypothetical protein